MPKLTAFPTMHYWVFNLILTIALISCQKEKNSLQSKKEDHKTTTESQTTTPAEPHFNIEVILRGADKSFGLVKFRQDNDAAKIINLGVWVRGLEPNHQYQLQRAVDTNLDGICTGTNWLTLGKGLTPQKITTNDNGTGREELWRDISSVATGTSFDIHFRVVDAVTSAIVLTSDCYQYTVR